MNENEPVPLEMLPFSYWDEVGKRWVKARYLAEKVIKARFPNHGIDGPPEIRDARHSGFVVR